MPDAMKALKPFREYRILRPNAEVQAVGEKQANG
jgi:hypothetical protein